MKKIKTLVLALFLVTVLFTTPAAAAWAAGDVEEVVMSEGSLEDMVVDSLVVIEDLVVEDRANVHQPSALGLYRGWRRI